MCDIVSEDRDFFNPLTAPVFDGFSGLTVYLEYLVIN